MATFRVYIPQLTKQITDRENTWVFSDPTYPDEYHLTIRREIDLTSTDSLWGLQMVAKSLDEQELSPSIYITKLQLVQGCDVGDEHCLSMKVNGALPRLLYQVVSEQEFSWLFAASPSSYCVFEITRVHTAVAQIQ